MKGYTVKSIDTFQTKEWILKKHYAKRMPSISYSFGLFKESILVGVCTFGMPPNYEEMAAWQPFYLLELNRLVVNEGLEKNSLSFFVGQCLKMLPKPKVIISYSDFSKGHYGYIYQATNWIYTGVGSIGEKMYIMKDGTERHQRHKNKINPELILRIEKTTGKGRYYFFCANRKDKKNLLKQLRYKTLPYPKGDNKRYNADYSPTVQQSLF